MAFYPGNLLRTIPEPIGGLDSGKQSLDCVLLLLLLLVIEIE